MKYGTAYFNVSFSAVWCYVFKRYRRGDGRWNKLRCFPERFLTYFPLSTDKNDPLRVIEKDLHILNHALYDGLDQIKKQQVRRLLKDLGVKSMAPSDLVTNHVIPLFKEDLWKVIVFFLLYIYCQLSLARLYSLEIGGHSFFLNFTVYRKMSDFTGCLFHHNFVYFTEQIRSTDSCLCELSSTANGHGCWAISTVRT